MISLGEALNLAKRSPVVMYEFWRLCGERTELPEASAAMSRVFSRREREKKA